MTILVVLIVVAVVVGLYVMSLYNTLVRMRNSVKEAWSDIEVQLKRRFDLIPNVLATVKGYAKHESETLEKIINARNAAFGKPQSMQDIAKTEGENLHKWNYFCIFAAEFSSRKDRVLLGQRRGLYGLGMV